jgi:hypothetical protein
MKQLKSVIVGWKKIVEEANKNFQNEMNIVDDNHNLVVAVLRVNLA